MLKKFGKHFIVIMLCAVIVVMVIYLTVRLFLMITASYFWYDKVIGSLLLFAEFFIITQGMGYLNEVIRVFLKYDKPEEDRPDVPELKTKPYVAILIPSYHEPLSVIEETIVGSYNLYYKNKHIILLDDTRYDLKEKNKQLLKYKQNIEELCQKYNINLFRHKWHGAKAGIINDYLKNKLEYIMKGESKEERFKRVAEKRIRRVLDSIRSLTQCSNKRIYNWNDEQLKKIWSAIDR
ncbi:hypothetical protein LCGC14_1986490, partial [marine sediment metagenome]